MPLKFPKPRPRALHKRDKVRADEAMYRKAHDFAIAREDGTCQLCAKRARQTHHMGSRKRSKTRGMAPSYRHDATFLLVVCGFGGRDGCHGLIESGEVRVYGTALRFTCERFDDHEKVQDWVPWVPPAKRKAAAA